MTTREALHTLLDDVPDDMLPSIEASMTQLAANATGRKNVSIGALFEELVARWREDTAGLSIAQRIVTNADYLRIIALGPLAVPLILDDLRRNGGFWYPALEAITGVSPERAEERTSREGMKAAWLRWGEEHGYFA